LCGNQQIIIADRKEKEKEKETRKDVHSHHYSQRISYKRNLSSSRYASSTSGTTTTHLSDSESRTDEDEFVKGEMKGEIGLGAPRLIVEALVVRKFTVEVEEAYLELDKLRL